MIELYDVHGQTEFRVYGNDGSPTLRTISYLVDRERGLKLAFDPRKTDVAEAMKKFEGEVMPITNPQHEIFLDVLERIIEQE